MDLLIILLVGALGSFMSGFIGGGAGIFTAPVLLFLGLPPHIAVGTARMGSIGLSVGSLARFLRSNEIVWKLILPLTLMSVPAGFFGAYILLSLDPENIERIIGGILILSAFVMVHKNGKPPSDTAVSKWISYPIFFLARTAASCFWSWSWTAFDRCVCKADADVNQAVECH